MPRRFWDRFRALDLFCGAGGAAKGLQMAGFHVTGVDIKPQPNYCGDLFIQSDALRMNPAKIGRDYDFVWASPMCQTHSRMTGCRVGLRYKYPDQIADTRKLLEATKLPWVIENVVGAPLVNPIMLCGAMFWMETYRHRLFESSHQLEVPKHPEHIVPASKAGHWRKGTFVSVAGNCAPIAKCREVMGIDWMNRAELAESIPPVYSWFIGEQFVRLFMEVGA